MAWHINKVTWHLKGLQHGMQKWHILIGEKDENGWHMAPLMGYHIEWWFHADVNMSMTMDPYGPDYMAWSYGEKG